MICEQKALYQKNAQAHEMRTETAQATLLTQMRFKLKLEKYSSPYTWTFITFDDFGKETKEKL